MKNYRTKWITLEHNNQMFTFTHYKELDGDRVLVLFYETNTGCGDLVHKETRTAEKANELYKWLIEAGWKITRNEWV